ncbi:MAG: hypothetical protein JNM75_05275 [Rhodospirillales bacterium]|nr:hypothetical protein [Rhodospirillales bacterium]
MGTYSGTYSADTITPDFVSAGVGRDPAGSTPSAAADTINGFGGNDILDGGGGGDVIDGGDGSDTINDSNAGNIIYGMGGNDEITIQIYDTGGANSVDNVAYGDSGNDAITLQIGGYGDLLGDFVGDPPGGRISLYGGTGNDVLKVSSFYATSGMVVEYFGGEGSDELQATASYYDPDGSYGGDADDYLYGGSGDDRYVVNEPDDHVIEAVDQGLDTVIAYQTDFILPENVENLQMKIGGIDPFFGPYRGIGNAYDNTIWGGETYYDNSYILDGMAGNDTIYGSSGGKDTINGGVGNDVLYGKLLGVDYYYLDADDDTIYGGTGNDLIYGSGGDADTWDGNDLLYGDDGNDRIFGSYGDDQMYGGTGADELGGQGGSDTMYGGAGKDKLGGGSGNDWLYGEGDADVLSGRGDLDHLSGGPGNDIFDYDAVTDSKGAARDVIQDFAGAGAAVGDRIDLSTIDANATAGGNQAFKFVGKAGFSGAGQVRVAASGADTLIQVNTDANKATVEMDILVKDGTATPTQWVAGDFIL